MSKFIYGLMVGLWMVSATAADVQRLADNKITLPKNGREADILKFEKDLQRLPWNKFRSIIEAVPSLKADVERYGPSGWKYVEVNFQSYRWRRNISKLKGDQMELLGNLIKQAQGAP